MGYFFLHPLELLCFINLPYSWTSHSCLLTHLHILQICNSARFFFGGGGKEGFSSYHNLPSWVSGDGGELGGITKTLFLLQ